MSLEPEEDFLDTELRNVFHDYRLPPAEHLNVWAGIEARIATLPVARTGLPSRLLLPLTAAVLGVALGWLLPHPAARPEAAAPASSTPRTVRAASPARPLSQATWAATAPMPALALAKAPLPAKAQSFLVAKPLSKLKTKQRTSPTAPTEEAASPITDQLATTSDSLETASGASLAAEIDSLPAASLPAEARNPMMPTKGSLASPLPMVERPTKVLKPKGSNEKIGYHKPTNRQSEQGRGIRRWFSHLTQTLRYKVSF